MEGTWSGDASQQRSHILTPSLPASDTETPAAEEALKIKYTSYGYWLNYSNMLKSGYFDIFLVARCPGLLLSSHSEIGFELSPATTLELGLSLSIPIQLEFSLHRDCVNNLGFGIKLGAWHT